MPNTTLHRVRHRASDLYLATDLLQDAPHWRCRHPEQSLERIVHLHDDEDRSRNCEGTHNETANQGRITLSQQAEADEDNR